MKKRLALALALVLCLGLCVPALAEEALDPFYTVDGEAVEAVPISDEIPVDWGDYDGWDDYDEPEEEPTLTLMVNGVASDIAVTAENGVSYADADALRAILGDKAVGGDVPPVPIRAAAEAAGWDVEWYDGGWRGVDQEVQLWDKASYEAALAEEFGALNDLMAQVMTKSRDLLFSEKATAGHEAVTVDLTRFSTLDGDKKYTLTLAVDYTVQKGVMDMTVTFDVAQLLQFVDAGDLAAMAREGEFTMTQLTQLLKAGKAELILDYGRGYLAYNVPLLALVDKEQAGWHCETMPGWEDMEELTDASFVSSLYANMTTTASYRGAEYAAQNYQQSTRLLAIFLGKDRFSTQNGKTTYSLTTQNVNQAIGAMLAQANEEAQPRQVSFFKHCDLSYTVDERGNISMDVHIRPDMEGIAAATSAEEDAYFSYGPATLLKWYLPSLDMDITANASGNQSRSTSRMALHWNNRGRLDMRASATAGAARTAPRQIEDVTELPQEESWDAPQWEKMEKKDR